MSTEKIADKGLKPFMLGPQTVGQGGGQGGGQFIAGPQDIGAGPQGMGAIGGAGMDIMGPLDTT